ncbi:MAG: TetR/AcrR family transcriptional regulator, partial [Myxococcales bacterium]|nr:TetR/AcrR family transcriptional regulator [Myxococcales bacterium]
MRAHRPERMRREPRQGRSRETVRAVLEAVPRVIQREGVDAVTTNRIAEAAGVSIGSLYQYFPDKRSIFSALHERHVEEVHQVIERVMAEHAGDLAEFTRALVEGLADLHATEPEL